MANEIITSKRKSRKWLWISGGVILFIILISGGEEKKEVGPAQISQPQASQEQQIPKEESELKQFPNPERGPKFCKEETIEKYGKDMFFFCGCYCGSLLENTDAFGNCLENCWKNFETIWKELPLKN